MQYEIRTYTLADQTATKQYFEVNWSRHIESLKKFQIEVESVFLALENCQVIAICTYPDEVDVLAADKAYMESEEFRSDMKGFSMQAIINVTSAIVKKLK
ncbi:NIPSNAP family protein [Ligilactobacillus sp. WILCCON 0076]|uniref:NIPSNAP family protein n=1 Tax=Ligilactobacillus ubinensis TaxID=2876789 RepID=A0A9X2JL53_9LACO|nr:NIPSNAP family protein [Ligilactobacillus ubinensis]MCP0886633.1 NIPSNAP family protein [Ligilactobacillus ubinensis]